MSNDLINDFRQEMTMLKKVNHPNVVRFLGIFQQNNDNYIVTVRFQTIEMIIEIKQEFMNKGCMSTLLMSEPYSLNQLLDL